MNKKCPNCGFINFVTAECCRKCEAALVGSSEPSSGEPGTPYQPYPQQGAPFEHYPSPYQVRAPQNNGGVPVLKIVLGLVGGLILVSVIAGVGVVFLKRSTTVSWKRFEPLQGNYMVMMPTEPRAKEPIVTPLPTGNMTNNIYTSAVIGQGSVLYCVVTYPTALDMSEKVTDAMVAEELNNILTENKATLLSKSSILQTGSRGYDFEYVPMEASRTTKKSKGYGKIFFRQNHEYLFLISASEGSALLAGKDKFLTPIAY